MKNPAEAGPHHPRLSSIEIIEFSSWLMASLSAWPIMSKRPDEEGSVDTVAP
jgi:hypothetical protein